MDAEEDGTRSLFTDPHTHAQDAVFMDCDVGSVDSGWQFDLIGIAARCNRLPVVQKLMADYVHPTNSTVARDMAIQLAAANGATDVFVWLVDSCGRIDSRCITSCIRDACAYGHNPIVKYIIERYVYSNAEMYWAFHAACTNGNLSTAELIRDHFHLTAKDLGSGYFMAKNGGDIMKRTCENGHFDVADWLSDVLGIEFHRAYAHMRGQSFMTKAAR